MSKSEILTSLRQASVVYRTEMGEGRRVWSEVSLDIHKGEWIVVIGPNGSGKSTLASVLLGLCPLSEGEMKVPKSAAVATRGVLQIPDAQFIGDTIREELDYIATEISTDEEEREAQYKEILSSVGLSLPVDRTLNTLSGGQKQLVNLAAALSVQPEMLVLDEPTAMLDPAARKEVRQAVRAAYQQGTTIVWITHRLEEVADATRVIGFGEGRITYDGEPRAFFYGDNEAELAVMTPCTALGLDAPFAVKTAISLLQMGCKLGLLPLNMDELAEAVAAPCL
ncbi:ATP-binding cassette domain-containing protein [Paenibacillus sp. HWE-109]|uniref:energy-coupling factor ABC transporter ATP-binding protein n=1 Tax=Paenibacillus sp. HWE-109 TaxID=1306526 RepID=UPI001EDE7408|nr:ATP-binding cassette domain-containing protein [Paenibacillus sp. HWE-109]UKS25307.1 ATP-binding cassette domain-containing protein [Paenibacillus sp. HWE-109]